MMMAYRHCKARPQPRKAIAKEKEELLAEQKLPLFKQIQANPTFSKFTKADFCEVV